jgi:hypothetical protein
VKLGTLVQFVAYGAVMDTGYVSKHDDEPGWMWVDCVKMGPQLVRDNSSLMEVISDPPKKSKIILI